MSCFSVQFMQVCSYVAPYLHNRNLKSLGCTCKTAQKIARKILKEREDDLIQQLSPYACTKMFNIKSIKEAKILCLGERHHLKYYKKYEKNIINSLAKQGPVLVVLESLGALKRYEKGTLDKLNPRNHTMDLIAERLDFSEHIHYIGWDNIESVQQILKKKKSIEKPFQDKAEKLESETDNKFLEIESLKVQVDLQFNEFHVTYEQMDYLLNPMEFDRPIDYLDYLRDCINKNKFKNNEQVVQVQKLTRMLEAALNTEDRLVQVVEKYNLLIKDLKKVMACWQIACLESEDQINSVLSQTFPKRVSSMVDTLKGIQEYIKKLGYKEEVRVVIIAGDAHFQVPKNLINDKNHRLDLFHKEIQKHRSAIFILAEQIKDYVPF